MNLDPIAVDLHIGNRCPLIAFDTDTRFYYLIWALVAVALVLVSNLTRSNRGRILRAMNGDQVGARSLGLHITRAKVTVFVISACLASVAGSLYASYFSFLSPDQVGSAESLQLITMLVIGGRDMEGGNVSVRLHGKGNVGAKKKEEVVADILAAIKERRA